MIAVLIAMVLLAVGIVGLSGAGIVIMGVNTEANVRATATSIAVSYMEAIKRRTTLVSESPEAVNESGDVVADGPFTRSLTVTTEPIAPKAKRLTVWVEYPSGRGRRRQVELVTIVFQG